MGDIVRVDVNEAIPCDLVMLSSEDPEGNCYITAANLDGETNLKVRHYHVLRGRNKPACFRYWYV